MKGGPKGGRAVSRRAFLLVAAGVGLSPNGPHAAPAGALAAPSTAPDPSLDEALMRLGIEGLVGLIRDGMDALHEGHANLWNRRCLEMCRAAWLPLVHRREAEGRPFGLAGIRDAIEFASLESILSDAGLPPEAVDPCRSWLALLPGYDPEKTGRQNPVATDQHGYVAMTAQAILRLFDFADPDVGARVLRGTVPWAELDRRLVAEARERNRAWDLPGGGTGAPA